MFLAPLRSAEEMPNPLIRERADPYLTRHPDGYYYFMDTVPEYDRLELHRAPTLRASPPLNQKRSGTKHATGEMDAPIWAPEIHFIDGK